MSPATFSPELETSCARDIVRKSHGTETRFRSLFALHSRYPALPDDGQQRADRELAVVWDGNSRTASVGAALHVDETLADVEWPPSELDAVPLVVINASLPQDPA